MGKLRLKLDTFLEKKKPQKSERIDAQSASSVNQEKSSFAKAAGSISSVFKKLFKSKTDRGATEI